jgi:hypothetical protein
MKDLDRKYQLYKELITKLQDKDGFVAHDECDSLLWSGLIGSVPGITVNIDAAFSKKTGTWHRRPAKDCWPTYSKSTISRHTLLGLFSFCINNKRSDIADHIVKHAISHFGFMGKGTGFVGLSRINIMPNLFVSFLLISQWGRYFKWLDRVIPADFYQFSKQNEGFQAHLSMLHCHLRNQITRRKDYKNIFKFHANRQPSNAFFRFLNGEIETAKRLLTDPVTFPVNRLPTRGDRKEAWLWQRDLSKDWKPAESNKEKWHTGGDFLYLYSLILEEDQ